MTPIIGFIFSIYFIFKSNRLVAFVHFAKLYYMNVTIVILPHILIHVIDIYENWGRGEVSRIVSFEPV